MRFRTLAAAELVKISRQEDNAAYSKNARRLNPLQRIDLVAAVKERKTSVVMQGVVFEIRYEGSKLFYKPVKGFTPCGWLEIKRVLSPEYML